MCSVDKCNRMQKEEFFDLNIKNFVSLNNFNDPPLSHSKKIDDPKRSAIGQSPANKIKRSKSKNKPYSK